MGSGHTFGRRYWGSLTLTLQLEYLDILPLYVVLLVAVPLFMLLERIRRGTGLLLSIALWLTAEIAGLNFPSSRSSAGWYFDPFAWQILFCVGLVAGAACSRADTRLHARAGFLPWLPDTFWSPSQW